MPAASNLVTLDHAKDWAKRLLKHGPYRQLAQAQEAVAVMLGHASWHALLAYYVRIPALPSASAIEGSLPVAAPVAPKKDFWEAVLDEANRVYPELQATRLVTVAHELDTFDAMPHQITSKVEEAGDTDYGWDTLSEAIEKAIDDELTRVLPPEGMIFLRVETARGMVLLTLPREPVPA